MNNYAVLGDNKMELTKFGWVILAIAVILLALSILSGLEGEPIPPTLDAPETWVSPTYDEYLEERRRQDSLKAIREKHRLEAHEERELRQQQLEEFQAEQARNITPLDAVVDPPPGP